MQHDKTKIKEIYQYHQHHLRRHPVRIRFLFYVLALALIIFFVTYVASGFQTFVPAGLHGVFSRLRPQTLLTYGLYTLIRILVAYIAGFSLAMFILLVVMSHRRIENFLVPILDILQSVPVLAFFPLIIIAFAQLHLPEIAAFIVLLVASAWPLVFGALGGLHQIPQDINEAAQIYGARGFAKFRRVIFPSIFPNLVTGSILSWGAGWNVIIISEYINYGDLHIRLPGLGNLLSSSAGHDSGIFIVTLIYLILIITLINRLIWHRLLAYSEKFKFE